MKTLSSTVAFQDEAGNALANGSIILTLASGVYEIAAGGGQVVGQSVIINLDATGKISGTPQVWASDELTPQVPYTVTICVQKNGLGPIGYATWLLAGSSPIDLSQMVSTVAAPFALPGVVLLAPAAGQTITGQALTLSSTAPLTVQGTASIKNLEGIRFADQFATGSSTGGIQEAINDLGAAPAGGTVILPKGVVNISATINITNREGLTIRGHGSGQSSAAAGTSLKWTGAANGTVMLVSSTRWSSFSDFTIDGNSSAGIGLNYTAVNAVAGSQKCVFQRITFLGVTGTPGQNIHVGSSTNDEISESAFIDCNHLNAVTCVFTEGTQTANIRFVGGMLEGYSAFGFDFEGGTAYQVNGVNFEDTVSTGVSVKGADLAALGNITFIDCYFEELAATNVAYSFPSGAGTRHAPTAIIGGRILFDSTATTQVVFDFEQHANLVIISTLFTANAPGQGGVIKLSVVGGTPNINSFHQVTLQDSWTIAPLGSNSSLVLDNSTATTGNISTIQTRGSGLELWSGVIQFDDANGVGKYRLLTNSNEMRLTDASGNIIWLNQGQNGMFFTEAASGAGRAGLDGLFADSTAHRLQMNNNNAGRTSIAGASDTLAFFASGGTINPARVKTGAGTALVAGDFALSAGFGTGATVTAVLGTDQAWTITVTAGTTPAGNPTITLTFHDGTWTNAPITNSKMIGGTGAVTQLTESPTATTNVVTFQGTPVAGSTYIISSVSIGR